MYYLFYLDAKYVYLHMPLASLLHLLTNISKEIQNRSIFLLGPCFAENAPEPESFVSGARHDGLSVRGHSEVKDTIGMSCQLGHLHQAGVLPDEDLILRVAVSAD